MGGIVQDIGNLFGGHSSSTDRHEELKGFGQLDNIFNYGLNSAKGAQSQGQDLLGAAGGYYKSLLSGNRQAALQATAPVASTANAQADAQKRNIAESGTARGGGVNAVGQQIDTNKNAAIDNAVNDAVAGAAGGAAKVGGTEVEDAAQLLGISGGAAKSHTDIASNSRATSEEIHRQRAADAGNFANQLITLAFG